MTQEQIDALVKAYRQDLKDMETGTYVAPLPHPATVAFRNGDSNKSIGQLRRYERARQERRASN